MPSMKPDNTIREYQEFVHQVYGKPNGLYFDLHDMLNNVQRFAMRGLKGIRKGDNDKTIINMIISLSWFMSTLNRLHIDLEDALWNRFPYLCSYCGEKPCSCKETKPDSRPELPVEQSMRPSSIKEFQTMFSEIYPPEGRTLDHAGVHLAEEIGELSEALLAYRGEHKDEQMDKIVKEAADVFSCFMGVFNSVGVNYSEELTKVFSENCHICRKAPCECPFSFVVGFES